MRAFNFSAGPATLPEPVLREAQAALWQWQETGTGVAEISHRSPAYMAMAGQVEADLRALLDVPDDYAVLFMPGGATLQQALLPLNLAAPGARAGYLITGHWGQTAMRQAAPHVAVQCVASAEAGGFTNVPEAASWLLPDDLSYLHVTANETIHGVELHRPVDAPCPVVADFSSSIASRPVDVRRYGVLYAGAQKNLGVAGITVVILQRALLQRSGQTRAEVLDYRAHAARGSMLNTPPTFNWYVLGLCLRWMRESGGVAAFAARHAARSARLYAAIDGSGGFYRNAVAADARSRINVPFFLPEARLEAQFVAAAEARGLLGLKGHAALGGIRASLYNALPDEAVAALIAFMQDFQRQHGH